MSNIMNNLHALGLNPFAVVLLAESLLKSQYVKHSSEKPLTFFFPVQRSDCEGWRGVRITLEAVPSESPDAEERRRIAVRAIGAGREEGGQ